jgi:hypothetical protein
MGIDELLDRVRRGYPQRIAIRQFVSRRDSGSVPPGYRLGNV